jgi:hypothetical protein
LTSFTEVDSGDDITVTDKKCEFDTMQRVANSYVHKDYGTDYFDDFEIEFEIELTATQNNSLVCVCAVTDSPGTYADHDTSNEGLMAFIYMGGVSNMVIGILNSGSFELSSAENRSTLAKRYATFKRSGTSTTFTLYTDAERTIVDGFFTKTVTSTSTPYDYLQVVASRDSGSAESITGYTQNFEIISN